MKNLVRLNFSFVNLLNFHKPLVIVDEAHNAKSDLSIEVLNRVNSACIIEYTATPAKNSNVIYSVSAAELKAEEMIKLPIILSEHNSPQSAITAAIQTRKKLEDIASKDKDYIRPIVLFQAEDKGKEMDC
jgi:type III restriction enzyme